MTGIAAPVIVEEMNDWTAIGGGNSGIVGDANHSFGFHVAANELPSSDYSRWRDPNGSDGPYVDWRYACAGDFSHKNDPGLREMHRLVLERLMNGELQMVCEFIGKPFVDQPVLYWARWNGDSTLQRYTGSGHDHWSHISWYRSRADQRAYLWTPDSGGGGNAPGGGVLHKPWPFYMPVSEYFGHYNGPDASHGGYYPNERPDVAAIQQRLIDLGYSVGQYGADGWFGNDTKSAVSSWQANLYSDVTTRWGEVWADDWERLFTY